MISDKVWENAAVCKNATHLYITRVLTSRGSRGCGDCNRSQVALSAWAMSLEHGYMGLAWAHLHALCLCFVRHVKETETQVIKTRISASSTRITHARCPLTMNEHSHAGDTHTVPAAAVQVLPCSCAVHAAARGRR